MSPSKGRFKSRMRNIAADTEIAQSSMMQATRVFSLAKRPKIANITINQNDRMIKKGIEIVSLLCT